MTQEPKAAGNLWDDEDDEDGDEESMYKNGIDFGDAGRAHLVEVSCHKHKHKNHVVDDDDSDGDDDDD